MKHTRSAAAGFGDGGHGLGAKELGGGGGGMGAELENNSRLTASEERGTSVLHKDMHLANDLPELQNEFPPRTSR